MVQDQVDRAQMILDLCVAARDVLDHLIPPIVVPPERYFSDEHLWRLEIDTVCELIPEYYSGVLACIEQQLDFPAAALTRCIHEVCYRFKYLAEHEEELKDWEEWQLAQDYRLLKEYLEHDVMTLHPNDAEEAEQMVRRNMEEIEDLLRGPPQPRRGHSWRTTSQLFDNLVATLPNNRGRGLRRHTIGLFSEYIHPRRFPRPPEDLTYFAVGFSVLLTLWRAMELCRKKNLLPKEADTQAGQIMEECERLLNKAN